MKRFKIIQKYTTSTPQNTKTMVRATLILCFSVCTLLGCSQGASLQCHVKGDTCKSCKNYQDACRVLGKIYSENTLCDACKPKASRSNPTDSSSASAHNDDVASCPCSHSAPCTTRCKSQCADFKRAACILGPEFVSGVNFYQAIDDPKDPTKFILVKQSDRIDLVEPLPYW